jgi:NADPH:quinone reductase-like Zn-dependent oxidoreductase
VIGAVAVRQDPDDPVACLELRDLPKPEVPPGWTLVQVMAATLNHHDVWSLRGVGLAPARLPIVLGCDAAGLDEDGNEVVVHCVIGDPDAGYGDETLDPRRAILSERHDGTFAELLAVPRRNLVAKPRSLSFEQAACLPVAWLTAYRMLFTRARIRPGDQVLVQGAGGGVAGAAIALAASAGATVYATSRTEAKREAALALGAVEAAEPGTRMQRKMDVVIETVGEATWEHSLRSLRPGGTLVVAGATSGPNPPADLRRVFYLQQQILGSTAGTRHELEALTRFVEAHGLQPRIDRVLPLEHIHAGLHSMITSELTGKIVVKP